MGWEEDEQGIVTLQEDDTWKGENERFFRG